MTKRFYVIWGGQKPEVYAINSTPALAYEGSVDYVGEDALVLEIESKSDFTVKQHRLGDFRPEEK